MDDDSPRRIRRIRAFLGITQERFAWLLGTSGVSVNRWELGKADPSPFYSAIFELLTDAIRVRQADEMIRRLEATDALPERLICMAVWLARPDGPPASLGRGSAPELDAGPPSSSSAPSGVPC
jgi:transcriptional regulator with XRE-family HTH domain